MIQDRSSVGTPRSSLIDGSAMFMIDASRTTTNCATASSASASQRRGSGPASSAGDCGCGAEMVMSSHSLLDAVVLVIASNVYEKQSYSYRPLSWSHGHHLYPRCRLRPSII